MSRAPIYFSPADFAFQANAANPFLNKYTAVPVPGRPTPTSPTASRSRRDGTLRWLVFIAMFCIFGLVIYFSLGHIWGYGPGLAMSSRRSAAVEPARIPRLYPRSVSEDVDSEFAALRQHKPNVRFVIIVIGWRRRASLERLCKSLLAARYHGYSVDLELHLDGGAHPSVVDYIKRGFRWPHGKTRRVIQKQPRGLEKMVVSAWQARDDSQFAFFFEDDLEASPFYFEFALLALNRYWARPGLPVAFAEGLVGIALNTPRFDEVNRPHRIWLPEHVMDPEERVFLLQQPCSWGSLYFPWKWRQFISFYAERQKMNVPATGLVVIPESSTNEWQRSWKRYLADLMYMRGEFMLYPSLPAQHSFSVHYREPGEHTAISAQQPLVDSLGTMVLDYYAPPLLRNETDALAVFGALKPADQLPIVAFHHNRVRTLSQLRQLGSRAAIVLESYGMSLSVLQKGGIGGCLLDWFERDVRVGEGDVRVGEKTRSSKYMTFQQFGPLIYQLDALANAITVAHVLNRTLIVPPFMLRDQEVAVHEVLNEAWLFFSAGQRNVRLLSWNDAREDGVLGDAVRRIVWLDPWTHSKYHLLQPDDTFLLRNAPLFAKARQLTIPSTFSTARSLSVFLGGCDDGLLTFRSMIRMAPFEADFGSADDFIHPSAAVISYAMTTLRGRVQDKRGFVCIDYSHGDDVEFCREHPTGHMCANHTVGDVILKYRVNRNATYVIDQVTPQSDDYPFLRLAESVLCARAERFYGHCYSLLSHHILKQRHYNGDLPDGADVICE